MKRSINFRGRAGKNLTAGNLQSLLDHYGVKAERTADGKVAVAFVSDEAVSVEEIALDDEYTAACLANSHDRHDDQDNG